MAIPVKNKGEKGEWVRRDFGVYSKYDTRNQKEEAELMNKLWGCPLAEKNFLRYTLLSMIALKEF